MRLYGAIGPRVDGDYFAQELASLDRAGLLAELKANHPDLYEKKYKEMAASLHICRG